MNAKFFLSSFASGSGPPFVLLACASYTFYNGHKFFKADFPIIIFVQRFNYVIERECTLFLWENNLTS